MPCAAGTSKMAPAKVAITTVLVEWLQLPVIVYSARAAALTGAQSMPSLLLVMQPTL